jgi:cellulose synthase/poly-beta-1,6-N-acetylglucosamine synthase-like glycosyltransferase
VVQTKEDPTLQLLISLIGAFYFVITIILALYGFHNMITTVIYLSMKPSKKHEGKTYTVENWPRVTVQLPIFNEKYTVERLLRAVTRLDYPAECVQIQVLDDSTDDTYDLVARLVEDYKSRGVNIELIHRVDRKGYKAGALNNGLKTATGELIAIFDADFVPKPDWLKRTVPCFQNPKLGCLQTRWGHTNQQYNSLTRAEAMGIDGHFIIEQTVRSKNGFFLISMAPLAYGGSPASRMLVAGNGTP